MTAPLPRTPGDDRLSAWLDGELAPEEVARLQADLAADPALAAELERARSARDALRRHGLLAAPAGLVDAVLLRLDEEEEPAPTPWRWQGWALAAVAVLVLWISLPRPPAAEAPDVSAAAGPQSTEVDLEGAPAVVLVASRWRLATTEDEGTVEATVGRAGGSVHLGDDGPELRAPADRILEVRAALSRLGALEDVGERRPAGGQVRVVLEVLR